MKFVYGMMVELIEWLPLDLMPRGDLDGDYIMGVCIWLCVCLIAICLLLTQHKCNEETEFYGKWNRKKTIRKGRGGYTEVLSSNE